MPPKFKFVSYKDMGLSNVQIEYIRKLVDEYMKKYPDIQLNMVCDFYSWDHPFQSKSMLNKELYTHNKKGERYSKVSSLAKHNDRDKLIGFNHIRLSGMQLENDREIQRIIEQRKNLQKKIALDIADEKIKISDIEKKLNRVYLKRVKKHDINFTSLSMRKMDVYWIRLIEETKTIKRITIHELAHAISQGYNLEMDDKIKALYEEYKLGFENLKEFIAECIMVAELTDRIPLANKVRARIS